MDIKGLIEGWRNLLIPKEELKGIIEATYNKRYPICQKCDEFSENKKLTGYITSRIDEHCTNCGCTLSAKTRCLSCECPLKKWMPVSSSEEEYKLRNNTK